MVITGFIIWFPIQVTSVLPGSIVPAAKLTHSTEAIVAGVFVLIWHLFHVVFDRLNLSMFTGRLNEDDMRKYHAAEFERLTGESADTPIKEVRRDATTSLGLFDLDPAGRDADRAVRDRRAPADRFQLRPIGPLSFNRPNRSAMKRAWPATPIRAWKRNSTTARCGACTSIPTIMPTPCTAKKG